MYSILAELPPERLTEPSGNYFKSLTALLNHIYGSDIIWLQRMRTTLPRLVSLQTKEIEIEAKWPTVNLVADFGQLRARRQSLDDLLVSFVDELGEKELEAVIDYRNSRGQRKRYIFWQALMHVFNHQTHHRGQVAEILDELGVSNDYSNIISTLSEPPLA